MNVFGVLTDNMLGSWSLDNSSLIDATGYKNGVYGNGNFPVGKINNSFNITQTISSANWSIDSRYTYLQNSKPFSVNLWLKPTLNGVNNYQVFYSLTEYGGTNAAFLFGFKDDDSSDKLVWYNGTDWITFGTNTTPQLNNWQMYTLVYNGSQMCAFINASFKACLAGTYKGSANTLLGINTWNTISSYLYDGQLDEIGLWNRTLSTSEITQLYNSGNGTTYPYGITNFTITNTNNYNNASISNFSAIINGTIYNTTNGTITTPISTASTFLWNITIFSNNMFNKTYINQNVSSGLSANQDQYPIIYLTNKWNNSNVSNTSVIINGITYTTTNHQNYIPLNNTYNITTNATNYIPTTTQINLSPNSINQINISQNIIRFKCYEKDSNTQVTCLNSTSVNASIEIYPNTGNYNWNISAQYNTSITYYNKSTTQNITGLQNTTINITGFYNKNYTIVDATNTSLIVSGLNCTYGTYETQENPFTFSSATDTDKTITCYKTGYYPSKSYTINDTTETANKTIEQITLNLTFNTGTNATILTVEPTEIELPEHVIEQYKED